MASEIKKTTDELIDFIINQVGLKKISDCCISLDLDMLGQAGRTPLMAASAIGDEAIVLLLMEKGANPNSTGIRGISPLHEASSNGHLNVMRSLVGAGSRIDSASEDLVTPLMCAAAWGHSEAVDYLLSEGANKFMKDKSGATAADIAEEKSENSIACNINNFSKNSKEIGGG